MSEKINDGGAAFRTIISGGPDAMRIETGAMSLRDYFAGQALAGFLSSYEHPASAVVNEDFAAERAYRYADAMLKAREENRE
jgi:hypothetical protein